MQLCVEMTAPKMKYVLQSTAIRKDRVGFWPPLAIELCNDGTVRCNGGPAHGGWRLCGEFLKLSFHHAADLSKMKTSTFVQIDGTDTFLGLIADNEWQAFLAPLREV